MAVSVNSVVNFNPTTKYQHVGRENVAVFLRKITPITSRPAALRHCTRWKRSRLHLLASGGDNVTTETSDKDSKSIDASNSIDESSKDQTQSNGASISTDPNQESSTPRPSSTVKRAPLTARERLRAARVLNRYTDTKPSKPKLNSRLLDALQESDKGKKRPGLPEAPTNLFDDSKRGMPKEGWTIDLPGGMDVFFIAVSFVLISTVMFATTYIVWKVGAIHFNEY